MTNSIRKHDETMANEEVLGPRKTMFVLVIVVGCFAVLWPRILSPLILGSARDQLKPNQFDRDAGCCEVIFETEMAVLELVNEVCNSAVGADGKLSPYAAAECRKSVNETCGLDIAAFLKRNDNVGKTTKMLLETMKHSNSSCLKENFGVEVWSFSTHQALNSWIQQDTLKQERPLMRGAGPHPALRERGRAIPAGAPTPPSRGPVPLPPHARVRTSPLSVYFELDIKPPPIPGMRPPLGSPGGPVPAPKSSMGFVMPIYTICIIVFFVYTLSKILFKRTGSSPYEPLTPDPQFRRRVFRDDSRSSPETKLVVTAISGLVAEVQQQMEASYAPNQQRQDVQDNHTRPYTNGTVLGNNAPVHIVTSEYREASKEKSPEPQKEKEPSPPPKAPEEPTLEPEKPSAETEKSNELETNHKDANIDLLKLTENVEEEKTRDSLAKTTEDFLNDARDRREELNIISTQDLESKREKRSTQELLEEALKEDSPTKENDDDQDNASVKHEAEDVKAIFLDTEIPQQSRVLVAEFAEDRTDKPAPRTDAPTVVSGKMTLSLIQDAPRDTPDRDLESTLDDFTTASAVTQPAAEKQDDLSEEEIEEEIEVEEIEEEIEEEEEEVPEKLEFVQKTEELKSDAESKQAETNQESAQIENEFNANEDADGTSKTEVSETKIEKDTELETVGVQENENKDETEEQTNSKVKTEAVEAAPESKEFSELETDDLEQNDEVVKEEDGSESDQDEELNEIVAKTGLKDATKPVVDDKDKEQTIDGQKKTLSKTEGSKKDIKKNQVQTEESSEEEEEVEEEEEEKE